MDGMTFSHRASALVVRSVAVTNAWPGEIVALKMPSDVVVEIAVSDVVPCSTLHMASMRLMSVAAMVTTSAKKVIVNGSCGTN
jgi:hypothetical protein